MAKDSSLFFFTGENTYQLKAELLRWKKSFKEKHGDENYVELVGKDVTTTELLDAVSVMPFIAEKRLILIDGIPKIEREDLEKVVEALHPQAIVAIVEPKPDKRLGIVKDIVALCQVKTFPVLETPQLLSWTKARAAECGATLLDAAARELVEAVGTDQWILDSEIRKLALFTGGADITPEHVHLLAVPSGTQVVWKLTDLIGSKRPLDALAFLRHRLERGEDPYGMWIILMNMVKNLTLVWSALEDGRHDERSISSATGLHFLAVRGLLRLAESFDQQRMKTLVDWVSGMDIALKTGGIHYTAEHQQEVVALAERTILMCR